MATIIFDFDDTLFDNACLKKDIFAIFKSFNIEEEHILETYKKTRNAYTFERHINSIKNTYKNIKEQAVLENLNNLSLREYIFPETESILKQLQQKHTLLLVSFGEESLQKRKISASNLADYFHQIHITQESKVNIIKNLELKDVVYFVNDKESENKLMKEAFPHFTIIHISPENPVSKINWQI